MVSLKKTLAKSAEGYPLLGYAVYWSIKGVQIPQADFAKLLNKLGIPQSVAPDIREKSALNAAIREQSKGRRDVFHRSVLNDQEKAGFVISRSEVTNARKLDVSFSTETKIHFDKHSKQVTVEGDRKDEIQSSYEHLKDTYTSERFRTVTLRIIRDLCQAVTIRDKGGFYFIPSTHDEWFKKLQKLFEAFPECEIDLIPVIDSKAAKKSIWKALVGEVEGELAEMEEKIAKYPDSERARNSRLDEYKALREKVENYGTLLSGTASEFEDRLKDIAKKIKTAFV